jgi:F-type H+/Na+-transporting ATPase subunit alpha
MADTTTRPVSASTELSEQSGQGSTRIRWQTGQDPSGRGDADGLPRPMVDRLLHNPDASLREMLSSVVSEAQAVRAALSVTSTGTVRQVGDGVASVWGLPQVTTDELLRFPSGVYGLVMNLEPDWLDCILLGSDEGIQGGDVVWCTRRRITVPVGDRLLGRVVSPLGEPEDGKGRIFADEYRFIERDAPGVVERQAVAEPLHTGLKAVDAIVPIGRGQRELVIGDRQTGKTSLALDTIINQNDTDVICVYVSIGQRKSSALQVVRTLEEAGAMEHTVVVMASPDDPPALLYLAPYAGCTVAESFLDDGHDVLIVYDDLSKHADAYRELSLLLRRPPGREAYPGDIFYLHARLLERAARISDERGGGSITALPIVETRRGNISAYIPTNLISITDGQIYLSPELFNQGFKPAIDVGLSVSRVGGAAQTNVMRKVSGQLKLSLAQYEEVAHFARFGTEIDRATRRQITRGERLREVLKQEAYAPLPLARQVLILYASGGGYLDELPVEQVSRFEAELWAHAQRGHRGVIRRIEEEQDLDDDLRADMDALIQEFGERFL